MIYRDIRQAGDTIVEVLIAIAIVSLVLTGAYASTRRSRNAIQTAQEQGEALKIAESQLEYIKQSIDNGAVMTGTFCFDETGAVKVPPNCTTSGPLTYDKTISKVNKDYTVVIKWDGLTGQRNNVELDYRAE